MNTKNKAIVCILISAFGFSIMNLCVKLSGDLPSIEKSFFRNLVAAIIAFILLFHLATRFHLFLRGDNGQLSIEILGGENHALGNNAFQLTGS